MKTKLMIFCLCFVHSLTLHASSDAVADAKSYVYEENCKKGQAKDCGLMAEYEYKYAHSDKDAIAYAKKACDGEDLLGCTILARSQWDSDGTEAKRLLKIACDKEFDPACINLSQFLFEKGDKNEAKVIMKKICNKDDLTACGKLGDWESTAGNKAEAEFLYKKACDLGNMNSCNTIGISYMSKNGSTSVNGRQIPSKFFLFNVKYIPFQRPSQPDQLKLEIDQLGSVSLSAGAGRYHLFNTGEVDAFIKLLKKAKSDVTHARFTKQTGRFKIGTIGEDIALMLETTAGGNFKNFSMILKSSKPDIGLLEDEIAPNIVDGLIELLSQKEKIISGLNGESDNVRVVRMNISKMGEVGASMTSLKCINENDKLLLSSDNVGFKISIAPKDKPKLISDISKALQYLKIANGTLKQMPDKKFTIKGFGNTSVNGAVESFDGNTDRFMFTAYIQSEGEEKPRWISIDQDQLSKFVMILKWKK